jgi:hypothetical protein
MKNILLLCSGLMMCNNVCIGSLEQNVSTISSLREFSNSFALSCTINLTGCKLSHTHLKKLAKTYLPNILNTGKFHKTMVFESGNMTKICLFNEEATVTIHVTGEAVYVEVTDCKEFNPYLVGAFVANLYKASYFSVTTVIR